MGSVQCALAHMCQKGDNNQGCDSVSKPLPGLWVTDFGWLVMHFKLPGEISHPG